jgi:hypothetical protein
MRLPLPAALAVLLAAASAAAPALAAPADDARLAREQGLETVTIHVDATFGMRKDGLARAITRAHAAFAAEGYAFADMELHVENGDVQGVFITYRRAASGR